MFDNFNIDIEEDTAVSSFQEILIEDIFANPNQPRKLFDIKDLTSSIKEKGFIGSIGVVKKEDKYMIVFGERRFKACKSLDYTNIKCEILDLTDKEVQELALIENIQREDLTPIEIVSFIWQLWESGNYKTHQEIAIKIGKQKSYLSKIFSIKKLNPEILEDIIKNKKPIGIETMQELSRHSKKKQKELYKNKATIKEIRSKKPPKQGTSLLETLHNESKQKTPPTIYIDTETTGLYPSINQLTEVACIIEIEDKEVERVHLKINPHTYKKTKANIDPTAIELTNKTIENIKKYEDSTKQFNKFQNLIKKYAGADQEPLVIIGYKTSFDIGFLKEWAKDNDQDDFIPFFFKKHPIDILEIVKYLKHLNKIDTPSHSLKVICDYFKIELEPHDAMNDIVATKELHKLITKRFIK